MKIPLILLMLALGSARADLLLSEFMASNDGSFLDGDGEQHDWIEIHNPTSASIDLAGWKLRDSTGEWVFPTTTVAAGGYLLVFASGQDVTNYVDAGGYLHTDFKLDADGEAIALLRPDGSIASEFSVVPSQRDDISYGAFAERQTLITPASPARFLVSTAPVADAWRGGGGFDDSAWGQGAAALGFGTEGSDQTFTAFQIADGVVGNQTFGGALGLDFVVSEPVLVTELGIFDSGSDGILNAMTAQLWRRDDRGTPGNYDDDIGTEVLATVNFSPASPGTLEGGSRFKELAEPVTLQPGNYCITGSGFSDSEPNGNLGTGGAGDWQTDDADGALQFTGRGRFGDTGTFPASVDGGPANRYAAGTFKLLPLTASEVLTDVGIAMRDVSDTILERVQFNVADPSVVEVLNLQLAYDDGFAVWINGEPMGSRNTPVVMAERGEVSLSLEIEAGVLASGANVLAIEGKNIAASDSDFLISPTLFSSVAGTEGTRYFDQPTPGAPNGAIGFVGFVADTEFSIDRGFFTDPFAVEITTETDGATIVYTTDGSEPSIGNGTTYTSAVAIGTTTVLRARAFRDGFRPTDIDTQTYLFAADIARQGNSPAGYPLDWSGTSSRYGMTEAQGDYARAAGNAAFSSTQAEGAIVDSLGSLPSLSIVTDADHLFDPALGIYVNPQARGEAWERPVSVELIHPDGAPGFQVDAGLRMMGFSSRNIDFRKMHMRLLFKKQYGAGTLDYPLFGDGRADKINTIALRGNRRDAFVHTNNATYIGDEWAKRSQSDMGQLAVRGTFVHLYLNGLYWGVYNPTERPDEAFAENYLEGEREDYDVIKFCCPDSVVSGEIDKWNQLLAEARAGIDTIADFQRVQGNAADGTPDPALPALLDVDNLIDYLIAGQFHGAWDWPGNYYTFRDRVEPRSSGFRFFTWDNDVIFDGGNPNVANKVNPDPGHPWWTESPGEVDIGIRGNPEYRMRFADRAYAHYFHDGALRESANIARWNSLAAIIRPALFAESARWGDANSALRTVQDHWDPMNSRMVNQYFPGRQSVVFGQLRAVGLYPSIDPPEFNQRGGAVASGFELAFTSGQSIYFTDDGSDPRLPGGGINPAASMATSGMATVTLVAEDAVTRARVPSDGSDGSNWTGLGFDDSSWLAGPGGVGYENGDDYDPIIGVDLFDTMRGVNDSAYIRIPFGGAQPEHFLSLTLRMRYDDGFIAYLNGTQIAAINEPVSSDWQSGAISSHEASVTDFVDFDVSSFIHLLEPTGNVLAIHGLNRVGTTADFVIQPVLEGVSIGGEVATVLDETVVINARVLDGGEWSALNSATFLVGVPAAAGSLVISEIYYNPPGQDESGEFIELYNPTSGSIDLSGVRFVAGIAYEFPLGTVLPAGDRIVLMAADYDGSLANGGEELSLAGADGALIANFRYDDGFPWPEAADGDGFSLVFIGGDSSDATSWRSSSALGGSPGGDDSILYEGGDPLEYALPDPGLAFTVGDQAWLLEYSRPVAADDARYVVEISTDLTDWEEAGGRQSISVPDSGGSVTETFSGILEINSERVFARVRVEVAVQ